MGKLSPEERWKRDLMERFTAMRLTKEFKVLRSKGLVILNRKRRYRTPEAYWADRYNRTGNEYREWCIECKKLGEPFGIGSWIVQLACLLNGYQPERERYVMETQWPRILVVTESIDDLFIEWLCYEAQKVGLRVIQRITSIEILHVRPSYVLPSTAELTDSHRPPRHAAFYMRVETPPGYPSEARQQLGKMAAQLETAIFKGLGYSVPSRLRTSPLVNMAEDLKIGDGMLPKCGIYEIIDEMYPANDYLSKDHEWHKLIKSRRYKLRKRLVEPYEIERGSADLDD